MTILIVDDEIMPMKHLESLINKHCKKVEKIYLEQNPVKALLLLKETKIDLIFLDIEMPIMNGFEFIDVIGVDSIPPVIFTTAYSNYSLQALKVGALDYLLKPIVEESLIKAVSKLKSRDSTEQAQRLAGVLEKKPLSSKERLVLASGQQYLFVKPENIIRVQANGSYTYFFLTSNRRIMTSKHLKSYSELLLSWGFLKTHQSHLINPNFIEVFDKADGGVLILKEGNRIPISTRLKGVVMQRLGLR